MKSQAKKKKTAPPTPQPLPSLRGMKPSPFNTRTYIDFQNVASSPSRSQICWSKAVGGKPSVMRIEEVPPQKVKKKGGYGFSREIWWENVRNRTGELSSGVWVHQRNLPCNDLLSTSTNTNWRNPPISLVNLIKTTSINILFTNLQNFMLAENIAQRTSHVELKICKTQVTI